MNNKTEIAIGIIRSPENDIFITQRGESSHLAGFWEFPGGKLEEGEQPHQTLSREILEEVDIVINKYKFLNKITHSYPDKEIVIHVYLIEEWDGVPFAKEGQPSRWVHQEELSADDFPDANRPIIEMLKNRDKHI